MRVTWTAEHVTAELIRMGETLKRLRVRGCWPAGYRSSMPEPILSWSEQFTAARERGELNAAAGLPFYDPADMPVAPPEPDAIARMEIVMQWPGLIEERTIKATVNLRRAAWLFALGMSPGRAGRALGCHRDTARLWFRLAAEAIAHALNRRVARAQLGPDAASGSRNLVGSAAT